MTFIHAGKTSTGRRSNNEDAFGCDESLGLYVVADGLGGYEGGEVASALVFETMRGFVADNARDSDGTWPIRAEPSRTYDENLLAAATKAAHLAIAARQVKGLSRMASTMVSVLVRGARMVVAHVGDSRLYRLRKNEVQQMTVDHSLWAEMQGSNVGTRADFPYKNQITRALGIDEANAPDLRTLEFESGDTYLLCSDGLYDPFDERDDPAFVEALLRAPAEACEALIRVAYERGSTDNLTAVVLRAA